ncbi:MAG: hypothetical protein CL853_02570 [Crocinitomicaceae bacterium]|nr:hypothetical protein [Crocinitomicaceae bacterium]
MEKQEIKKNLEAFVNAENELAIKEAKHLVQVFNALYLKEIEAFNNIDKTNKEDVEPIHPKEDELNREINQLIEAFNQNRKAQKEKAEKEIESNIKKKTQLLKEFEELIKTKENIGYLINGIKSIRERWSSVGNISRDKHNELQADFSKLNDEFNYNINIYKELKENDLKVNFSLKNKIIHELKELEAETKIKSIEENLKKIQLNWDSIGPTFKEHWEDLKNQYWELVHNHYDRIKNFYKEQKQKLNENLEQKKLLIEKAKLLVADLPNDHKTWEKLSIQLKELQETWKSIGPVPKKVNDKIWNTFREHFDNFYSAKKEFYNERNSAHKNHAEKKKILIEKIEQVVNSMEFDQGVKEIKKIQNQWKTIGHAGKYAEQKLWREFRSKCDAFFNKKDLEVKAQQEEFNQNLILKLEIIDKIKAIDPKQADAKELLINFRKEYALIGKSPKNKASETNGAFEKAVLGIHKKLSGSAQELQQLKDEFKIINIKDSYNPERTLQTEKDKIRKRINAVTKEVLNYENNLGFFSSTKGDNPLLKNVTSNIEKGKKEIEKLKNELKKLSI